MEVGLYKLSSSNNKSLHTDISIVYSYLFVLTLMLSPAGWFDFTNHKVGLYTPLACVNH